MRQLVDNALNDAQFVRKAIEIVRSVPAFDELGEVHALYQWVKRNIRYTKDPVTKEKLYPPQEVLKIRAGDCDDISMLLGAFLLAIGYPARWVTISASADNPAEFSHVYVEAEVPAGSKNWVPLDAARLDAEFGAEPPIYYRKRAWSIADDSYEDLSGNKRRRGFLNGIATVPQNGLGDFSDMNWQPIVQQSVAEIPAIISASSGRASSTTSPYGSFATGYTPGYGIPPAGYMAPVSASFGIGGSSMLPLLAIGALALLMFVRRD